MTAATSDAPGGRDGGLIDAGLLTVFVPGAVVGLLRRSRGHLIVGHSGLLSRLWARTSVRWVGRAQDDGKIPPLTGPIAGTAPDTMPPTVRAAAVTPLVRSTTVFSAVAAVSTAAPAARPAVRPS